MFNARKGAWEGSFRGLHKKSKVLQENNKYYLVHLTSTITSKATPTQEYRTFDFTRINRNFV